MVNITPERLVEVKAAAQKAHTHDQRNALRWMGADDFDEYAPEIAEYIANTDPDFTLALISLVERSREAEATLRHLHGPDGDPETNSLSTCGVCTTWEGKAVRWPCPTIQTLDSIQETA